MFSHKHNFQCFNTVGHQDSHRSSLHHLTCLPPIPQHGMVVHHQPEKIYLCSDYRHPQTREAFKREVLHLCHHLAPHQHHPPHHCVHGRPLRSEEAHAGSEQQVHHHRRHSKRMVLVKNSDPSISKTIVLHHRSIRSLRLFLEEASELMQYHIRKLYTAEGHKIDSVQSLMQCPSILVCVGHEPSHPSILENFRRSPDDRLPEFNLRSQSNGCTEGHEGLPTHVINPKLECNNRSNRHIVSSDKSLPDETDSPDNANSCSPTGDGLRQDDIEKAVHVNKDGSLSMEMKVHFRLQNDETLHWSTKVKKIRGRTRQHLQRHNNTCFAQVSQSYSESENISTGEQDASCITGCCERHTEDPHYPHCCVHQHGAHGASRHIQTSSSSASSHTVVSRKTVTEKHIRSRSSEENVEQVEKETYIKQTVEAAETEEYCTIRSDTCSKKSIIMDNCKVCVVGSPECHIQTSETEEQAGAAISASSQLLTDHKGVQSFPPNASRGSSLKGQPEKQEPTSLDEDSPMQDKSLSFTDRAPISSLHSSKSRKSKNSHTCHCGVLNVSENDTKGQSEIRINHSSAMSAKSNVSSRSNKSEKLQNTECGDVEEKMSESAMSVQSNASKISKSSNNQAETKIKHSGDMEERSQSAKSMKSGKSKTSKTSEATPQEDSEDTFGENVHSAVSLKAVDIVGKVDEQEETEEVGEDQNRVLSVMSFKSNTSASSKHSNVYELKNEDTQDRTSSAMSEKSKSKYSEVQDTQKAAGVETTDGETLTASSAMSSNKAENDEAAMDTVNRSPSTMSVKSNASTRSRRSRTSESLKNAIHDKIQSENEERRSERSLSPMSVKSNISSISKKSSNLNNEDIKGTLLRPISAMSAKSNVSAGRPRSTMSVKSSKSMKTNSSTKSGKSKYSNVSNKATDDSHYDKNDAKENGERAESRISKEDERSNSCVSDNRSLNANDEIEERATSVKSEISSKSKSSAICSKSKASTDNSEQHDNDEETAARAASTMSAKSSKSNTSALSTNSNVNYNGNICDESDDAHEPCKRSPSSISGKSATSNISARSTNSKSCGGSNSAKNGEEWGPSVLSVNSSKSVLSVKSSKSTLSCILNTSELNGVSAEENAADSKEHGQQAQSNLSTSSTKSLKSNASTISKKSRGCAIPSEIGDAASEKVEETEERVTSSLSVKSGECSSQGDFQNCDKDNDNEQAMVRTESSMSAKSAHSYVSKKSAERAPSAFSVKSAKSHISSKSKRSTASGTHSVKAKNIPGERDCGEETQESTASKDQDIPGEENISVHEEHAERAPSNLSIKSVKSVKSTVSKISDMSEVSLDNSLYQPDTRIVEGGSEGRAMSSMSGQTGISAVSNKPKCPADAIATESSTTDKEQTVERLESSMSVRSAVSHVSVSDNILNRAYSVLSGKSGKSHASSKSIKSNVSDVSKQSKASDVPSDYREDDLQIINGKEYSNSRSVSLLSLHSLKSSVSGRSNRSKCSSDGPDEEITARPRSHESTLSMKSNVSECPPYMGYEDESQRPEKVNNVEHAAINSKQGLQSFLPKKSSTGNSETEISDEENEVVCEDTEERTQSAISLESNKLLPPDISVIESYDVPDGRNEEDKSNRAKSVMSGKSMISLKSNKSKASDVTVDKNTKMQSSLAAEITAVAAEETDDRALTAMSSKSNVSARSKRSSLSEVENKSERRPQSSLTVKSNLSKTSNKSKLKDIPSYKHVQKKEEEKIPTASNGEETSTVSPVNVVDAVNPEEKPEPTSTLHKEDKYKETNDRSSPFKKSKSSGQYKKTVTAEVNASAHLSKGNEHVISHTDSTESDLSQTLSSSDYVKDTYETLALRESNTSASNMLSKGRLETTNIHRSGADNQSGKSSKCKQKITEADDLELVPSSLPNASPSEVVNEWLKTVTTDGDVHDIEELSDNYDDQKNDHKTEDINRIVHNETNIFTANENPKYVNEGVVMNTAPNNCQTNTEASNTDSTSAANDDTARVFHSSVHVMKVLLNPKVDRCNSLPEISPVYGHKLSTSARGLLDCLVKLQLINHDPKKANEKNGRYHELMNILKSLWLCDPPENEHMSKKLDDHYMDDEFHHTSSSGVDVTSGSTGSGKNSDGVNGDLPQPHTTPRKFYICEGEQDADVQCAAEKDIEGIHHEIQKGGDPATDDTIRKGSPSELSETPPSLSKSLANDSIAQNAPEEYERESQEVNSSCSCPLIKGVHVAKSTPQDLDPVLVLTLLTKIEKQFMAHYINAVREFKVRWNLNDNEQLDTMICELKTEVHKRIQTSINEEMRKIQSRAGLPRPPTEAMSHVSTTQTEERRRRLKIMLKQSVDPQERGSDELITGTLYSNQRSENDDYCPCETCIMKKNKTESQMENEDECNKATVEAERVGNEEEIPAVAHDSAEKNHKVASADEPAKETSIDETAVINEDEPQEEISESNTPKDESGERNTMADITDHECDECDVATEGAISDEEETLTLKAQKFADEIYDMAKVSSKKPAEQVSVEDEMEVTGKDEVTNETTDVQTAVQENAVDDEPAEADTVDGEEEAPEATTPEGKNEADEVVSTNIQQPEKEETMEKGAVDDGLALTSEGDLVNENNVTIKAEESSEQTAEMAGEKREITETSEDEATAEASATEGKNVDSDELESDNDEASDEIAAASDDEDEESEATDDEATTDNEFVVEKDNAATSEDELEEEAAEETTVEEENVEGSDTAGDEQPKEPSVEATTEDECVSTRRDELEEEATEASEDRKEDESTEASTTKDEKGEQNHESSKDENLVGGTVSDEEKITSTCADECADKNNDTNDGKIAATTENALEKLGMVDEGGETADTSDDNTAEDDATGDEISDQAEETATTQDKTAVVEERDLTSEDESMEELVEVNNVEEENPAKESDVAVTSEGESDEEEIMEAEMDDGGQETAGTNDEDETADDDERAAEKGDDVEEKSEVAETTQQESDKDAAVEEGVPADGTDEHQSDDKETVKAKEENATDVASTTEGIVSTNDESSEETDNMSKACRLFPKQETSKDGELLDNHSTVETVPESTRGESPMAVTKKSEENCESDTEDNESVKNSNDSEGGEGSSEASSDSEGAAEDKVAKDENETGQGSQEVENEQSGTEAVTTEDETEERETSEEESGEAEETGDEISEGDDRDSSVAEAKSAGEEVGEEQTGREEPSDNTEDESAQDSSLQELTGGEGEEKTDSEPENNPDKDEHTSDESDMIEESQENDSSETKNESEGPDDVVALKPDADEMSEKVETERNVTQCECNVMFNRGHCTDEDDVQASEEEGEETEIANKDWRGVQGDSADGEDEAEEDSEESGEECDCAENTSENQQEDNRAAKETTTSIPINTLSKMKVESEDGVYADAEDSETETNQEEGTSFVASTKSWKWNCDSAHEQ